jgi:serine phosphatase RsbU (regulator of sigma subunit)
LKSEKGITLQKNKKKLVDVKTQEVVEANRKFTEIFGYFLPEDTPFYVEKYIVDSQQKFGKLLRGFHIDITGHGLATALQTSSLNALLRETSLANLTLAEQIKQIDSRAAGYLSKGSFASMLGFELDLALRELRYVGGGITHFFANGRKIVTPGMLVGVFSEAEFETGAVSMSEGDTFFS